MAGATNVNEKLEQNVSFQVSSQWGRVNEQSKAGFHRDAMSKYSHAHDNAPRLEIPPLDSFTPKQSLYVNDYQQSQVDIIRGPPQQNLNGFQNIDYNNRPFGPFLNQGPLPYNPILHQEFLQNNLPLGPPQNGPMPNNVFENVPNILNPPHRNNGQNFHQNPETYSNNDDPGPGFQAFARPQGSTRRTIA